MADNPTFPPTGLKPAADEVSYSGDTAFVQLGRLVKVTGTEGSKTVVEWNPATEEKQDDVITALGAQATAANQATEIASLAAIDGKLPTLSGGRVPVELDAAALAALETIELGATSLAALENVTVGGTVSVTGVATETTLASVLAALGAPVEVDGTVELGASTLAALETVQVGSSALPTGAATETTLAAAAASLAAIDAGTPAALGQTTMAASVPVAIASNQSAVAVSLASVPSHAVTNAGTFAVQDATAQASLGSLDASLQDVQEAPGNPSTNVLGVQGHASGIPVAVSHAASSEADGHSLTLGVTTGAKVVTDATGTIQQYLRGLVSFFANALGAGTAAAAHRTTLASDDPAVATLGATTGAKVVTDANGTIQQYLRGIIDFLANAKANGLVATAIRVVSARDMLLVQQTPTVSTSPAYTAGDAIGGVMTWAGAGLANGGHGCICSASIANKDTDSPVIEEWIFQNTPGSPAADNAAFDFTDANLDTAVWLGTIDYVRWDNTASGQVAVGMYRGMPVSEKNAIPYTCGGSSTSVFSQMVTRSTPTQAGTSDLVVTKQLKRG